MNNITLLILAAGMGSRYKGLKQFEAIGAGGETLLEYNLFNAIRNGVAKVVFVIRSEIDNSFLKKIVDRVGNRIQIEFAIQKLDDLVAKKQLSNIRTKPWGTLHAVLAAREIINTPFIVINADDFYGLEAFTKIIEYYQDTDKIEDQPLKCVMVGYPVKRTLIGFNQVNRGICVEQDGFLIKSEEHKVAIDRKNLKAYKIMPNNQKTLVADNQIASMNCWGFPATIFPFLVDYFHEFLQNYSNDHKSECFLPDAISNLIQQKVAQCKILITSDNWFGITYPEDKAICINKIGELTKTNNYPTRLWQ